MPDALTAVVLVAVAAVAAIAVLPAGFAFLLAVTHMRIRTAIVAVLLDDGPCPWPYLMERVTFRCGHRVGRDALNSQLRALEAAGIVRFDAPFYSARITSRAVAMEGEKA